MHTAHTRCFTLEDQVAFAALSGDFNPLHVDPLAARRTLFGRPVVHGIHLMLWGLSSCLERPVRLSRLKASFSLAVGIDEPVECRVIKSDGSNIEIALRSGGQIVASVRMAIGDVPSDEPAAGLPPRTPCQDLENIGQAKGMLPVLLDAESVEAVLPGLVAKLSPFQVALALASTRLVGMECPGLHSIYSRVSVDYNATEDAGDGMRWDVEEFDPRSNHVAISIAARHARGSIIAFVRPKPQVQPSTAIISSQIDRKAFANQRSLVIGGSRGIGEVCAKILAAGGSDVRLTFVSGEADAKQVAYDIASSGGLAQAVPFDVLSPPPDLATCLDGWFPTHVYYFATPTILPGRKGHFQKDRFDKFAAYYVSGLANSHNALRALSKESFCLLYPSSVYVDENPSHMAEYAAAKAAGEALCKYLGANDSNLLVKVKRLPRLPTDQTVSVADDGADTADIVSILYAMLAEPF